MYRDSPNIVVLNMDDNETNEHLKTTHYDKIVHAHFDNGTNYSYNNYGDDAFYLNVGMDPKIKKTHFFIDRDMDREKKLYNKIVEEIGSDEYNFIHEKPEQNIIIDRTKIKNNLPIVFAKPEYSFFDMLYTIEMAKEVHVISSCFLSFFMVKKINKNIFAHMYSDRIELSNMILKNEINVI
jgi:formyltetrahydrofolate synthetase